MPKTGNKPTIAVDIDDVLAANAEGFTRFSNEQWGTKLTIDDYTEHWAKMWQTDYEEEKRRRDEIVEAKVFLKYRFFDEARPVLAKLKQKYRLVVVSSRGPQIREDTLKWLDKQYKGFFAEVHFAKIWDDLEKHTLEKLQYTEGEILKQIGADYLIDDQPKHCFAAAEAGIKAVLFGDYKWNRDVKLPANVLRAKTWQAVEEYFDGLGK